MVKNVFRKISPSKEFVQNHKSLRGVAHLIQDPNLFHLNRHSVSRGVAIGLGVAMLPIPGHMLFAALLAIWQRANLAISSILVWIANPLTLPFILIIEYRIGAALMGLDNRLSRQDFRLSEWQNLLQESWQPLLLGSVVLSLITMLISYFAVIGLWRWDIVKKRDRREKLRRPKL